MQYKSKIYGSDLGLNAIIPSDLDNFEKPVPVLYLLHGLGDNNYAWMRKSAIEKYVKSKNIAVIMPDGFRGWYTNSPYTYNYMDMLTKELPEIAAKTFHVSQKREDTFIAGLSMGGYGAMKAALTYPKQYGFVASLSGVLDMAGICERFNKSGQSHPLENDIKLIFGEGGVKHGSKDDLLYLASKLADSNDPKPVIRQYVGYDDFLYKENRAFKNHVENLGFDYKYGEAKGGHEWDFWDLHIQAVLSEIEKYNSKVGK